MRRIALRGWRHLVVLLVMLLVLSMLIRNLFAMQVLQADSTLMEHRYREEVVVAAGRQPVRGTIVDANGMTLVDTITVYKIGALPKLIAAHERSRVAKAVAAILFPIPSHAGAAARAAHAKGYRAVLAQLSRSVPYICLAGDDSESCALRDDVSKAAADAIQTAMGNLKVVALDYEPRSKASYPNGPLAAQVLGFVKYRYPNGKPGPAIDEGLYGLEENYNDLLSDIRATGGAGGTLPQGATLKLTLDSYIQLLVEQDLQSVLDRYNAESGTIIVERPSDGAILAMASNPGYDARHWQQSLQHFGSGRGGYDTNPNFVNPAVSAQYEPGSTFKAITVAMGLDSGSFQPGTPIQDNGTYNTDGIGVQDWCVADYGCGGWGRLDVTGMLRYSSNVGATKYSQLISAGTFYDYLDRFGFGKPTGVDLAGEVAGAYVHFSDYIHRSGKGQHDIFWVPAYKDTIAYGQGIAVTPLQIANAYAALANGGVLPRPYLVQSYTLHGKTTVLSPAPIGTAVKPETARQVTDILVNSAVAGEACKALVPGYDIAAKTGTASIPEYGVYSSGKTIASTAAFGPTNLPPDKQFVVLVIVRKPDQPYGSQVAAPVVHDVMRQLFNNLTTYTAPSATAVQPGAVCSQPASN